MLQMGKQVGNAHPAPLGIPEGAFFKKKKVNSWCQRDQVFHKGLALEEEREAEIFELVHLCILLPRLRGRLGGMGVSEGFRSTCPQFGELHRLRAV